MRRFRRNQQEENWEKDCASIEAWRDTMEALGGAAVLAAQACAEAKWRNDIFEAHEQGIAAGTIVDLNAAREARAQAGLPEDSATQDQSIS